MTISYDTDPYKHIVRKAYKEVFGRQPDEGGLNSYSTALQFGRITEQQLYEILKSSDEYKKKNTYLTIPETLTPFTGKIAYIQEIYADDFDNAITNVMNLRESMSVCIIIYDDTITSEQVRELETAGAYTKYSKWLDNLPVQRNVALNVARELKCDWVCSSDPDEHYNLPLAMDLQDIIAAAEQQGYDLLQLNCHDIRKDNEFQHIETSTDYYKDLIYKLKDGVRYEGYGNLPVWHEGVLGLSNAIRLPSKYYYTHEKSRVDMLFHNTKDLFIAGGGPNLGKNNLTWVKLKEITDGLHITTWNQMHNYLKRGNIDKRLVAFMVLHKDDHEKDGDQNARAMFQYYFEVLHPEENHLHLTNIDFEEG
jgi:hypothetical protein